MNTDRELLELAAKAAGIEIVGPVEKYIVQFDERHKGGFIVNNERGGQSAWNPFTDDGDALRLAVKLRLDVIHNDQQDNDAFVMVGGTFDCVEDVDGEASRPAATRLAIVRAAAEIGRGME